MKRVLFVLIALLVLALLSLIIKPSHNMDALVMGIHEKPIIFNIY